MSLLAWTPVNMNRPWTSFNTQGNDHKVEPKKIPQHFPQPPRKNPWPTELPVNSSERRSKWRRRSTPSRSAPRALQHSCQRNTKLSTWPNCLKYLGYGRKLAWDQHVHIDVRTKEDSSSKSTLKAFPSHLHVSKKSNVPHAIAELLGFLTVGPTASWNRYVSLWNHVKKQMLYSQIYIYI